MRVHRIYYPQPISSSQVGLLDKDTSHYLKTVLRAAPGQLLQLFDGQGQICDAEMIGFEGRAVKVRANTWVSKSVESPIKITLAQGISRGEKMDYTLQKAVELGVTTIVPLMTERVGVKLDAARAESRLLHWQKIIISACEQSGRNTLPQLMPITPFATWITTDQASQKLILDPHQASQLNEAALETVSLLVGPEGGFSADEVQRANQQGYVSWVLGPRILRTETAALVALSVLQYKGGGL